MTPSESIKRESEAVSAQTGRYIPPYRLAALMKIADKITNTLTCSTYCITYQECCVVLDIVSKAIVVAVGREEKHE